MASSARKDSLRLFYDNQNSIEAPPEKEPQVSTVDDEVAISTCVPRRAAVD